VAAKLRKGDVVTLRECAVAGLYSACVGLVIGLIWYNYWGPANPYFLIGVSGLAGLGGVSLADVIVQLMARGGVKIVVQPHEVAPPLGGDEDE
jgi:ABC-type Fe3+-siderophore transport system permease subunit